MATSFKFFVKKVVAQKGWRNKAALSVLFLFQSCRVLFYRLVSPNSPETSEAVHLQPVLLAGAGVIRLGKIRFGVWPSPEFLSSYAHVEARGENSSVVIGNDTPINNRVCIIAEACSIEIGEGVVMGFGCTIMDSDFHPVGPHENVVNTANVIIEDNVFMGSNVSVLKGVKIGCNSVVASGAVVTSNVPANSIVAGVPARIIKTLLVE
jgi:acetyltransferase-like isoleucine patch superfamily enzyme